MSGTLSPISMLCSSSKSRLAHLYRNRRIAIVAASVVLFLMNCLQIPAPMYAQRKKGGGPRAVAVLAWNGDSPKPNPNTSVLTPVTILVEGRYYDANLYQAQPEPLAVDPGVMYDVLQNGDPIGTFTVGGTRNKDS